MANSGTAIDGLKAVRIFDTLRLNSPHACSRDEIISCIVALNKRDTEQLKVVFDFCGTEDEGEYVRDSRHFSNAM